MTSTISDTTAAGITRQKKTVSTPSTSLCPVASKFKAYCLLCTRRPTPLIRGAQARYIRRPSEHSFWE